ncbi:MAG: hypothetical protein ACYCO3_14995, partial [Mycobacteriales bacterium]
RPETASLRPEPASPRHAEPASLPRPAPPPAADGSIALLEVAPAERQAPTWPCRSCGASVDFAAMSCPDCGSPFLVDTAPLDPLSARLPQLSAMSSGRKVVVMAGGTVVLSMVFIGLFFLLGLLV